LGHHLHEVPPPAIDLIFFDPAVAVGVHLPQEAIEPLAAVAAAEGSPKPRPLPASVT
jgi:hypothetical protein